MKVDSPNNNPLNNVSTDVQLELVQLLIVLRILTNVFFIRNLRCSKIRHIFFLLQHGKVTLQYPNHNTMGEQRQP